MRGSARGAPRRRPETRQDGGWGDRRAANAAEPTAATRPRGGSPTIRWATRALLASRGKLGRADLASYRCGGLSFADILGIIGLISEYTVATFPANLDRTRIDPQYRLG
jgi:hypothetical protein